jgi:predicted TPR repeat methyltransferase
MTQEFDAKAAQWDEQHYRVERAERIAEKILEVVPVSDSMKALEFGCGTGLLGFKLIPHLGELTFADTSMGMLEQVNAKIAEQHISNARSLHLETHQIEGTYDLIVSLMVLHHLQEVETEITNLVDKLQAGGYICLCDLDKEDGSFHQHEVVPHNGFEREYIEEILLRNHVAVVSVSTGYVNRKEVAGKMMEYPVFVMIGKKRVA